MGDFFIEKDLYGNTNNPWINFSKEKIKVFNSARFESSATYLFKGPTGYSLEDLFPTDKFATRYLFTLDRFLFSSSYPRFLPKYFNDNEIVKIQEEAPPAPIFPVLNMFSAVNDSGNIGFITGPSGIHVLNKSNNIWSTATCFGKDNPLNFRGLKCNSSGNILFLSTITGINIFTGNLNDWKQVTHLTGDNEAYDLDCNKDGNIISFGSVVNPNLPLGFPPDFTNINSGSIYIWKEENSNWTLSNTITGTGHDFGRSISMNDSGNIIVTSCMRSATINGTNSSGALTVITGNGNEWKISQILSSNTTSDNFGYTSKINKIGNRIFCSAYNGPVNSSAGIFFHDKSKIHIYTGDTFFIKTTEVSGMVNIAGDYNDTPIYSNAPGFGHGINTNEAGNILFVGTFNTQTPYNLFSPLFVYEKELNSEVWSTGIMYLGQRISMDRYAKEFIVSNSRFPTSFNSGYYYASSFPPEIEVYENDKISFYKEYNYWTDYNQYKTGGYILPKDCKIKFLNFNISGVHINELNPGLELYKDKSHLSFVEMI